MSAIVGYDPTSVGCGKRNLILYITGCGCCWNFLYVWCWNKHNSVLEITELVRVRVQVISRYYVILDFLGNLLILPNYSLHCHVSRLGATLWINLILGCLIFIHTLWCRSLLAWTGRHGILESSSYLIYLVSTKHTLCMLPAVGEQPTPAGGLGHCKVLW
jgi:hypothetical protein